MHVKHFCVVTCVCASLFGVGSGVAPPDPIIAAFERPAIAGASINDGLLNPTPHPIIPDDPSRLWLVPARQDGDARTPTVVALASGVALFRSGRYVDALPPLSVRPSLVKPAADYAAFYEAHSHLKLGRFTQARREFAALTDRQPVGYLFEAAFFGEAEAATAAGDHAGAQRAYERLLAHTPAARDEVWVRLGRAAQAAGNRARAIVAFSSVYEEFPLSRHAPDALSALSALHGIEPLAPGSERFRLEFRRAELLLEAKRYDEARAAFERLQRHASTAEHERIDARVAVCHYFTKQYAAARARLGPYRTHSAFQAEARFFDLVSVRALGDHGEFERLADRFLQDFSATEWTEETLNTLGTHYIQRNRDDDADAVFRRLLAEFPNGRYTERAAWKVGWRAYRFGNLLDAVQTFEQAAVRFPRSDYRPAYLYWAARGREARGEHEAAGLRYALVLTDYRHSYYGRLVEATLDRSDVPLRASFVRSAAASTGASTDATTGSLPPNAEVIRLLLSAGLYDDATNEIRYAQHRWGDSSVLQATLGWLEHQKGNLLAGARAVKRAYPQYLAAAGEALPSELTAVIFPLGYWSLIREHATRLDLDPYLLAALIAQESGFVPDIRSPAKATGLMQLMPVTAQRYARKLALPSFSPAMLTRPDTNLRLGAAYFADLMRVFGEVHLALASYNAGESRVQRWMAERPDLSPEEFVDDIPFPETQNYVKTVLGAAENYRRVYGTDAALPSDPDRAIPSVASRRLVAVRAQPRPAVPQTVSQNKPATRGSKSNKATATKARPARTSKPTGRM